MIKKVFVIIIVFFVSLIYVRAQEEGKYKLSVTFSPIYNNGNTMSSLDIYYHVVTNGIDTEVYHYNYGGSFSGDSWGKTPTSYINSYNVTDRPSRVGIRSVKSWGGFLGIGNGSETGDDFIEVPNSRTYVNTSKSGRYIDDMRLSANVELIPVSINLHYYYDKGQGAEVKSNRMLPDKDPITLKATKGFVEATYQWEYQIIGETNWKPLPEKVSYTEGKSVVTFKGEDLMTETDYQTLVESGKSIAFRINAITDEARTENQYRIIVLKPTFSAPHIISSEIQQERCHGSQDAAIYVRLDRALQPNETIGIARLIGNLKDRVDNIEGLDSNNGFYIRNLASGNYTFALLSAHSNGLSAYNQASSHLVNSTITERPAITHSFSKRDISCFAGSDGTISLTASGGTGRFKAHLFESSGAEVRTQDFTSTTTLSRLPAGQYTLKIYDSNNCFAKDGGGNELIHRITLAEPSEAVSALQEAIVSPLAYNSSDGSISVRVSGGTPLANGYHVRFISKHDGKSFKPSDVRPDGNAYIYTLSNIPRGEYKAIIEDARFEALTPEDKNAPCGCRAEIDLTLSAPPPLEVEVKESRFVSCHGDSNGEITAHAKGGKPHIASRLPYLYTWYKLTNGNSEELRQQTDSIARGLSAGQYQVKITDANNISVSSAVFTLVQPEPLSLNFKITSPNCSGGEGSRTYAFKKYHKIANH